MQDASPADLLVALAYPLLLGGPVLLSARWMRGGRDFFAAGRRLPWLLSGLSLFMAGFTTRTFASLAVLLALPGWSGLAWFLALAAAHGLIAWSLASRWRRTRSMTPVEFTRERFGPGTQRTLGVLLALGCLLGATVQLLALGRMLEPLLSPGAVAWCLLAAGLLVLAYTLAGGLWAVALTDAFHFILLVSIALVVAALSPGLLPEGLAGLARGLSGPAGPLPEQAPLLDTPLLIALGLSQLLATATAGAPLFFSVPDEKDARAAGLLAAGLFLLSPLLFGLPALVAHLLPPLEGEPARLWTGAFGEGGFLRVAWQVLPSGLKGLLLVALAAATLSSLNLLLLQAGALFCRDIRPRPPEEERRTADGLRQGRLATLAGGLLVMGLALALRGAGRSGFEEGGLLLLQAPLGLLLVVGLLGHTVPRRAALVGLLWGAAAGATALLVLRWAPAPAAFLALGTTLVVLLASRFLRGEYRYARHILRLRTLATAGTLGSLLYFGTLYQAVHWGAPAWELLLPWRWWTAAAVALLLGLSLVPYGRALQGEQPGEREDLGRFFLLLATPVDRKLEAPGEERSTRLACGFLGVGAVTLGLLVLLMACVLSWLGHAGSESAATFAAVASLQVLLGGALLLAARPRPTAMRND